MKVRELISMLNRVEPETEVYTFYDHGMIYKLDKEQVILVDEETTDKFTPKGIFFCSHHDDTMDYLKKNRKYKSIT